MKLKTIITSISALIVFFAFSNLAAKKLTIEALHQDNSLNGSVLRAIELSPEGDLITYLKGSEENSAILDLWAYDTKNNKEFVLIKSKDITDQLIELSEEEKNRRERRRIYVSGIISYSWADSHNIIIPFNGDIYLFNLNNQEIKKITNSESYETDAKLSPDGNYVSYVRENELYIYDLEKKSEKQLTFDSDEYIKNATAEFVVQEELGRSTGYWWSKDSKYIISTQIDESNVEKHNRIEFSNNEIKTILQSYPFAGTENVKINLRYIDIKDRTSKLQKNKNWIKTSVLNNHFTDYYIVDLMPSNSGGFYVKYLARDQKKLLIVKYENHKDNGKIVISDKADHWLNMNDIFHEYKNYDLLYGSEKEGFLNLYKYSFDGKKYNEQKLTSKGNANSLECVNEADNEIFFSGWQESPRENHLYRLSMNDLKIERITKRNGWHNVSFSSNCNIYSDNFSSDMDPLNVSIKDKNGEDILWLSKNEIDKNHPYYEYKDSHEKWVYGTIENNGTKNDYRYLLPAGFDKNKKYPVIIYVYGGPHAQIVRNGWSNLFLQFLADQGYVVFSLDNRGMANRGVEFEKQIYLDMGNLEVVDQVNGVKFLKTLPFVDADKIGVYGWSYGGYMTLMMMAQYPEIFKYGVSGAPVTRWGLYDTAYTERYMSTPQENENGYEKSSVFNHIDGLGKVENFLLIHGMADDNVFFTHSVELMNALQDRNIDFELMTYPGEKHGFRKKQNRIHRDQQIINFFNENLKK